MGEGWQGARDDGLAKTIAVRGELTVRTARRFCDAVDAALRAGVDAIALDLAEVKTADAVGLAAVLQATQRAEARAVGCSVVLGAAVHAAALRARMLEELPCVDAAPAAHVTVVANYLETTPLCLASTDRIVLRQPSWDELPIFERWAHDPLLDQMVASDLLYQCRNLGAYHPDFVAAVFADARALTVVVVPHDAEHPVGFVRLYGICLSQQFAFLETAMGSMASVRRAWGIDASRLLLAYACDTFRLERVEAKVYGYNVLSANSLRRNGFKEEGVLREARMYDGQRWDISVFSILADEMRAQRASERFPDMGLWSAAR